MNTLKSRILSAGLLLPIIAICCWHAFAQDRTIRLEVGVATLAPLDLPLMDDAAVPDTGTFWSAQRLDDFPPYPFNPFKSSDLGFDLDLPVYSLGKDTFLYDDRSVNYDKLDKLRLALHLAELAASGLSLDEVAAPKISARGLAPLADDLQLDIEDATNGVVSLTVLNPISLTNSPVWDVFGISSLSESNWTWLVRTEPGQTNLLVPMLSEVESYYRLAATNDSDADGLTDAFESLASHSSAFTNDTDGDGLLDGWEWKHFGGFDQTGASDYDSDGSSNLAEQSAGTDPNSISFKANIGNGNTRWLNPAATITVLGGVPSELAVLVDGTNFDNPVWQPFTTAPVIALPNADGEHWVWVALRGRENETAWQGFGVTLDRVPPVLVITSPTNSSIAKKIVQVHGHSTDALSSVGCVVSNDAGVRTNRFSFVTHRDAGAVPTNHFQCFDVRLTNGVNILAVQVSDPAGNMTTTNISLTYDPATNPPALLVLWPQDGAMLGGNSFTLRARVNDETAEVNASVTGTNGVTQDYSGQVERDGAVWIQNMTLTLGTNQIAITAADGAGHSVTTNIVVVRSGGVTVTIDDVPAWQLNQPTVTLTGAVSDSSYSVWVNGTQASVTGGVWTALNVPVPPGGMAAFTVVAIPPGGSTTPGGGGIGDPADPNPSDPGSVQASIQPETGSWVKMLNKTWNRTDSWDSDLDDYIYMRTGKATFNESTTWEWREQGGGYGITVGSMTHPEWLVTLFPDNWTIKYWVSPTGGARCEMTWNWVGQGGGSYTTTNLAEFGDEWILYAISEGASKGKWGLREAFSEQSGGVIAYHKHVETWAAATDQELSTGGIGGVERESVIRITAAKAVKLPNGDFESVPPTQVSVTGFGNLNTNATVDRPKPDNSKGGIDLDASADTYILKPINNTGKYRLAIMRGSEDITGKKKVVWAGEGMTLTASVSGIPVGSTASNYQWSVAGPAYADIDYTSQYGRAPLLSNTTNSTVHYYWAKEFMTNVTCSVEVGGQRLEGKTTFEVRKPEVSWTLTAKNTVVIYTNVHGPALGCGIAGGTTNNCGMLFEWKISNYKGYTSDFELRMVQLVNTTIKENFATPIGNSLSRGVATNGLDTAFPFDDWDLVPPPGLFPNYPGYNFTPDSPYELLSGAVSFVSREDSFTSVLLFRPSGGKYVPLKTASWSWAGKAGIAGTNGSSTFQLIPTPTNPQSATGYPLDVPPTWEGNIADMTATNSPCWKTNTTLYPVQ